MVRSIFILDEVTSCLRRVSALKKPNFKTPRDFIGRLLFTSFDQTGSNLTLKTEATVRGLKPFLWYGGLSRVMAA